ncbi:MAG: acetyltransferase [Bacteroidia bacterium]
MAGEVIIVGAGGLGREALMVLREMNRCAYSPESRFNLLGFVADSPEKNVHSEPIIGTDEEVLKTLPRTVRFVVAIGNPLLRQQVANKYLSLGFESVSLIHPSVSISEYVHIGGGTIILPGAVFTTDIQIGRFNLINPAVSLSHDVETGEFVTIGPGAILCGGVKAEAEAEIGAGAVVLPRLTLGKGCMLGAGAVATRDLEAGKTYAGIPARPMLGKLSGTP